MMSEGPEATRRRLVEAAGREFAEKGFEGATVRSICERAEANIAAVNYHFGGKDALYERAVVESHECGALNLNAETLARLTPEGQLEAFVRQFLGQVVGVDSHADWRRTLMLREMARPSSASVALANEVIGPRFAMLGEILLRLCPGADERKLAALRFSVVGQCLFYKVVGEMAERLTGPELFARLDLDYLTRHVTTLVLAALGRIEPLDAAGEASRDPEETRQ